MLLSRIEGLPINDISSAFFCYKSQFMKAYMNDKLVLLIQYESYS